MKKLDIMYNFFLNAIEKKLDIRGNYFSDSVCPINLIPNLVSNSVMRYLRIGKWIWDNKNNRIVSIE
nr:hypothetical protein [uncultured Leptotrichia sp.]